MVLKATLNEEMENKSGSRAGGGALLTEQQMYLGSEAGAVV